MHNVKSSAIGTANHTPVIPKYFGITIKPNIIKPNVLKKEIMADTFPLDNAVKIADEKILKPENKKLNTNIENPFVAILYTSLFVPVKSWTKLFPLMKENIKISNELIVINVIHILYIFLNLPWLFAP